MIDVALHPNTVPTDRAADVTVRVTNRSEHPLHGLFVQLDAGTAAMVVTGALQIERTLLAPGESVERIVGLCGREPGTAVVTVPNVSYRVRGESVRQPVAPLQLTVLAVAAEPPPSEAPAGDPRQLVFVSYRHSAWPVVPAAPRRPPVPAPGRRRVLRPRRHTLWRPMEATHRRCIGQGQCPLGGHRPGLGGSRILQEGDVLRHEIATALRRGILVLPVLYGDAGRPRAEQLPPDSWTCSRRHLAGRRPGHGRRLRRIVVTLRQQAGIRPRTRGSGGLAR